MELGTYSLSVPGAGPDFETSEMWVGFDGSSVSWIEAGVLRSVGAACSGTHWFTAASYPNSGGFQLRCLGTATLNTKAMVRLQEGSGSWSFHLNGSNVSTWSSTPATTAWLDVGHEYTRGDVKSSMTAGKMKWRHTVNNNWYTGWDTPSYPAPAANPGGWPCYTMWVSQFKDMRARCNIAAANQDARAVEPALPPKLSPVDEALRVAKTMGVTAPKGVRAVAGDRTAVNALFNTDIRGGSDLTVVQIDGDFRADGVPRPQNAAAPTGTSLTVVLDQTTGEVQMIHLWPSASPDIASFGTPTTIA
ncbi:hypothetical protein [Amycolatopsis sp. 195334CR]|uniref:hypothetical protein n=1 Tax=Amycolatopsis sp. 195334CR TaxID=2814588 RepID=UPI001A8FC49F|nr:hypothetical protein [Amycolatopsis sp. 195334CR]MBN6042130.1 hypothetical protein [Amycolatopsis sp. 195334CR]